MATKNVKIEPSLEERFLKHAATKSEAKRVMNLALGVTDADHFAFVPLSTYSQVKGIGKNALTLIATIQIEMLEK